MILSNRRQTGNDVLHDGLTGKKAIYLLVIAAALALSGCGTSPPDHSSRYTIDQDRAPDGHFDVSGLADATPRYEPPRSAGNKSPYTVWGKSYQVLGSNAGYVQRGTASWYGEKFHGHKTSNGETFNMYAMSAAHKNLRIPSYARVTNLDNGRSVVVRVNDRGPFHGDRLIDLSYAAAKKLGYQGKGTARVEVAAITVRPDGSTAVAGSRSDRSPAPDSALFVQLGSFSEEDAAESLLERARRVMEKPMRVREVVTAAGQFHRVQVGPFSLERDALEAQALLENRGFAGSMLLTDNP